MEQQPERKEGAPEYNLRTRFDETREAIAYVERGGWLKSEERIAARWDETSEGEQRTSLEGARRWLEDVKPNEDARRTVYGDGGVNRWFIYADGRVRLSRFHASPDALARAQEKGFWIE